MTRDLIPGLCPVDYMLPPGPSPFFLSFFLFFVTTFSHCTKSAIRSHHSGSLHTPSHVLPFLSATHGHCRRCAAVRPPVIYTARICHSPYLVSSSVGDYARQSLDCLFRPLQMCGFGMQGKGLLRCRYVGLVHPLAYHRCLLCHKICLLVSHLSTVSFYLHQTSVSLVYRPLCSFFHP